MNMMCFLVLSVVLLWSAPAAGNHLYVAPDGADENTGAADNPFRTLERARDEIRAIRRDAGLPEGGIQVMIKPGEYVVRETFRLTAEDSGTEASPIVYRAAGTEPPRFTGGVRLSGFSPVQDAAVLAVLPETAHGKVLEVSLDAAVLGALPPLKLGGFGSGRGFVTHPTVELFVDGAPMTPARWPNEGFVVTGEVPGPLTLTGWDNRPGAPHGRFRFQDERLRRWKNEPDAWLYGYWYWHWADSYEKIEKIDLDAHEIILAQPWHSYGYRKGQPFFALHLLSELDAPGEWHMDRSRGKVFLYPRHDLDQALVELSVLPVAFVEMDGASHIRFEGILWECGAADAVRILGGENCRLVGCTIRKMAGNGVEIRGGKRHAVLSSDIHTLGRGGIVLDGGDRKTLVPAEHLVENCHIHHISRIDRTYTPAVLVSGVGSRVRHCRFHNIPSSAMRVNGNDHLVELNEIYRVVQESDDQGAIDMWGNPTYRGNVFRYNYFHHLGNDPLVEEIRHMKPAAIRLDDAISDVLIYGNVFYRCSAAPTLFGAVQIHGGKDNLIHRNLFVECGAAVSFTPWAEARWRKFVQDTLDAQKVDWELYLQRYPLLERIMEGHDANTVRENAVLRSPNLFLRAPASTESIGNREYPDSEAFGEDGAGRMLWSAEDAEKMGMTHIPFQRIGLYQDTWQTDLSY